MRDLVVVKGECWVVEIDGGDGRINDAALDDLGSLWIIYEDLKAA